MTRVFDAWNNVVLHTRFASLDDWLLVVAAIALMLALLVPVARKLAL
ncbi:MAG: hypothetical protein JOZ16_09995 [Methylobacteriaceae bacterium]|nr:hypothetical protein [Methylobacteriaceae bacterium]